MPEIDVKEREFESLEMVAEFLGEAACLAKNSTDSMAKSTVISLYSNGIGLPRDMVVLSEHGQKTVPIVRADTIITDAHRHNFLP